MPKLHNVIIELKECYNLHWSIYIIEHAYKALLQQTLGVSAQDKMKTGKVKPIDKVFTLALKLVEMQCNNKEVYEASFLFLFYFHY